MEKDKEVTVYLAGDNSLFKGIKDLEYNLKDKVELFDSLFADFKFMYIHPIDSIVQVENNVIKIVTPADYNLGNNVTRYDNLTVSLNWGATEKFDHSHITFLNNVTIIESEDKKIYIPNWNIQRIRKLVRIFS